MNLETTFCLLEHYKNNKTSILEVQQVYYPFMNTTKDKGWRGKVLEKMLYIENKNTLTDFEGGELKSVPITFNEDGEIKIKETTCIHVLNAEEIINTPFENSSFFEKIKNLLFVLIDDKKHTVFTYKFLSLTDEKYNEVLFQIREDYNSIADHVIDNISYDSELTKNLTGRIGKYVQPRPKYYKNGDNGYAFYFKKDLLKILLEI